MRLEIKNGRDRFYQWDVGQRLLVNDKGLCNEIHFVDLKCNAALVVPVKADENDRFVDVPDILLQEPGKLLVYCCYSDSQEGTTQFSQTFSILPREKPESYVYTESEVLNYASLESRIDKLVEQMYPDMVAQLLAQYFNENPISADSIGALTNDSLRSAIDNALTLAKESGEFKGDPGIDGKTPVKGVDYYTEEDKRQFVKDIQNTIEGIPDYWRAQLDEKIVLIREVLLSAGVNKSAFFFYTDSHWNNATTYTAKMAPALLKYLYKNTPINKTNFGGDIVSAEGTDAETMAYLWEWRASLNNLPNHHSVVGNHDDGNATNHLFSENYVYGYLLAPEESCDIIRGDGAMYYYIDNAVEKTRYLYLDTAYQGVTSEEQAFVKSTLLSTPEDWHIVAIAHAWYHNDYTTYPPVLTGFDTNAKILLDMFDNYNARNGDFAECAGWVEFCIGGHYHLDHIEHTDGGIPVIILEADCLHDRSGTMPQAGTTDEAAVSAVVADYNKKIVSIIRIGRGEDLETTINVSTVKYTNVIPNAIDSTGAIFNCGKGWAESSRIGSGKLESYIGGGSYYITGHIEIDQTIDNTIRLRNITFASDTSIGSIGIAFYNASFARVYPLSSANSNWLQPAAIAEVNGYDPVFDGTNIVQFTLKTGTHIDNSEVKYIAICAEYIGDDSIITINEPIDD